MKIIKRTIAVILTLVMLSGTFVCFAAELNQDAVSAHYGQYKNYVLLGDSAASGYRDEVSENDELFNEAYNETVYYRVEGSYADIIADSIVEDGSMTAFAAPGFRTIEIRYMLEDDFAATCEDEYLFHTSHLYVYEDDYCSECQEYLLPGSEHFRKAYKAAIAQADLITLGVGGNDWGAYLSWVITDLLEAENVGDKYIAQAKELLEKSTLDIDSIEKFVEIAHIAGALPSLLTKLPEALNYGLSNFYKNWDIMIQDIYDLNDDVTLMVVGMSDNSFKGKYYDYNGVTGELVNPDASQEDPVKAQVMTTIIDFIMSVGNKPMIEGAEKFGYTYVDINGATYIDSHYDADGHAFVANKIIEALPDAKVSKMFDDVKPGHKNYSAIEFAVVNGMMDAVAERIFAPEENLTKGQLSKVLNAIDSTHEVSDDDADVSQTSFAVSMFSAVEKKGIVKWMKTLMLTFKIVMGGFNKDITRAQAAQYIYDYNNI